MVFRRFTPGSTGGEKERWKHWPPSPAVGDRPKLDLSHMQDPEAKEQADQLLEGLKKVLGDEFRLTFVDVTTLTLGPPLRACWMKIRQQKRVPATRPKIKQKRHVFGGYDWVNDTITWTIAKTMNSLQFIGFLEQLMVT